MATYNDQYLNDIDALIAAKHLLNHTFYQAWSKGTLSKECLADYAGQYYHHVKAFPTYLSAVHAHTEDQITRRHLLQNLIEEEAGQPNHPDLWRQFALSLGLAEQDLEGSVARQPIQDMIAAFKSICSEGSVAEGIAALYSYESQIPPICTSKIDGLRKHYGMKNRDDWHYFTVHIEADKEHAAIERQLLSTYVNHGNVKAVTQAVNKVLDALWNFLTSLCERHSIVCPCG